MNIEIRTITSDEFETAARIAADAFGSSNRPEFAAGVEQARGFYPNEWHLATFEEGEMTSMMRMLPFAMRINGRALPFAAIGPVANSPQHRRKGHTGAMMRDSLRVMRERGQSLAGLHTPHPAFYRRYGWEIAADELIYTFKPKDGRLAAEPGERGRLRAVSGDSWHELNAIYRGWSAYRNGALHRAEVWWRNAVLGGANPPVNDAVIWQDGQGRDQGYAVISQPAQGPDANKVILREMVTQTPDAYLNLILYLMQHDIHSEIVMCAPSDDPMPLVFADPDRLAVRQNYTVLLRLVDVEAALRSRPLASPDTEVEFTIAVRDDCAPWNEGVYRLAAHAGEVEVERTKGGAGITVDARTLAPIFNGYVAPSKAAAAGLIMAADPQALRSADAFFAAGHRPFCWDGF